MGLIEEKYAQAAKNAQNAVTVITQDSYQQLSLYRISDSKEQNDRRNEK
jgi:hypothetical protein